MGERGLDTLLHVFFRLNRPKTLVPLQGCPCRSGRPHGGDGAAREHQGGKAIADTSWSRAVGVSRLKPRPQDSDITRNRVEGDSLRLDRHSPDEPILPG